MKLLGVMPHMRYNNREGKRNDASHQPEGATPMTITLAAYQVVEVRREYEFQAANQKRRGLAGTQAHSDNLAVIATLRTVRGTGNYEVQGDSQNRTFQIV